MNRKQVNKSRMYGSTDLVLNNHSLIFGTMNELVTAHQKLKDGQLQIVQYRQIQEADNSGMTANKRLLKAALIKIILKFSSALRAYATSIKNEELKVNI